MGKSNPERANFTALERRRELPRSCRGIVALLEQRMHALTELGQLRGRPLAPEQIAAQFGLELLDRPRERGLSHVALVRRRG